MDVVYKTIGECLEEVVRLHPDREALVHRETGARYTYTLLGWETERASRGLLHLGIGAGDRVAIWSPNVAEWIVAMLALAKVGAVMVPVDPGSSAEELLYILNQAQCRAVVVWKDLVEGDPAFPCLKDRQNCPGLEHLIVIGDASYPETLLWSELTALGEETSEQAFEEQSAKVDPRDPVAIMYTSGTTGGPKGVLLNHIGLINKSLCSAERQGLGPEDRLCLFFPLFHMFGNTCIALTGLLQGATLVMPSAVFDPAAVLKALRAEACTALYGSPSMVIALLDHPEFSKKGWKSVTKGVIGGSPCPMELMRRLVEEIGVRDLCVAYGITEASSWITMTFPQDSLERRVGTIGTALPCSEVKIVDPGTGDTVTPGRQGELCTRGFLMKGYYRMPAATTAAIDREGWFHTGDLGVMDDEGYVRITGRLKDVIVRGGVEIYPAEVEEIFYGLAEVSEVQVFGYEHPAKGMEVAAWVRLKEGATLSPEDLARYAEAHLEPSMRPGQYRIVDAFPMTRSGKVQKFRLAEMAAEEGSTWS